MSAPASPGAMLELLTIRVGDLEFGLDLASVKEVIRPVPAVHVPGLPPFVAGVIKFRKVAIPVLDLGARFQAKSSLPRGNPAPATAGAGAGTGGRDGVDEDGKRVGNRLVISAVDTKVVAFAVDGASEIVRVAADTVLPPAEAGLRNVVSGLVPHRDRLLVWLDVAGLLSSEEKLTLDGFRMARGDLDPSAEGDGGR